MDDGKETENDGQRRTDGKQWTMASRRKTMDDGEETEDDGRQKETVDDGPQ